LGPERSGAVDMKAEQALAIASQLREAIDATGHDVVFDFDHPPEPPDLDRVDLWDEACDAAHPVAFVVVPGYLVDGHEAGRRMVYTQAAGAAGAAEGHAGVDAA